MRGASLREGLRERFRGLVRRVPLAMAACACVAPLPAAPTPPGWDAEEMDRIEAMTADPPSGLPSLRTLQTALAPCWTSEDERDLDPLLSHVRRLSEAVADSLQEPDTRRAAALLLARLLVDIRACPKVSACPKDGPGWVEESWTTGHRALLVLHRGDPTDPAAFQGFLGLVLLRRGSTAWLDGLDAHLASVADRGAWARLWASGTSEVLERRPDPLLEAAAWERLLSAAPQIADESAARRGKVERRIRSGVLSLAEVLEEALMKEYLERGVYPEAVATEDGTPVPWVRKILREAWDGGGLWTGDGAVCLLEAHPGLRLVDYAADSSGYSYVVEGSGFQWKQRIDSEDRGDAGEGR